MCYKYYIPIVNVVYSLNGKIHVELSPRVKNYTREQRTKLMGSDELTSPFFRTVDQQSMEGLVAPCLPDTNADIAIGESTKLDVDITRSCNGSKLFEPIQLLRRAALHPEVMCALHWRYTIVE